MVFAYINLDTINVLLLKYLNLTLNILSNLRKYYLNISFEC